MYEIKGIYSVTKRKIKKGARRYLLLEASWYMIHDSKYIIFEFKNYTKPITQKKYIQQKNIYIRRHYGALQL